MQSPLCQLLCQCWMIVLTGQGMAWEMYKLKSEMWNCACDAFMPPPPRDVQSSECAENGPKGVTSLYQRPESYPIVWECWEKDIEFLQVHDECVCKRAYRVLWYVHWRLFFKSVRVCDTLINTLSYLMYITNWTSFLCCWVYNRAFAEGNFHLFTWQ
jgi:hypothetical protein